MHLIIQFVLFLPALVVRPIHIGGVVFAFASNLSSFQPPDTWIQPLKSNMVSTIGRTNTAAQMYRFDSVIPKYSCSDLSSFWQLDTNSNNEICHSVWQQDIRLQLLKSVYFRQPTDEFNCSYLSLFQDPDTNIAA